MVSQEATLFLQRTIEVHSQLTSCLCTAPLTRGKTISWIKRLQIAEDAARGYLVFPCAWTNLPCIFSSTHSS